MGRLDDAERLLKQELERLPADDGNRFFLLRSLAQVHQSRADELLRESEKFAAKAR
jgi:hypothetical protein